MNKRKNSTKRSFVMSLISLFVCVAMLIGTTFAWFTDTVTSGKNHIQAGNLDIEFEYALQPYSGQNLDWKKVDSNVSLFSDIEKINGVDHTNLWEPGHTEVAYLKVSNKGTLATQYKLMMNVVDNVIGQSVLTDESGINKEIDLTQYLKAAVIDLGSGTPTAYIGRVDAQNAANASGATALVSTVKTDHLLAKTDPETNKITEKYYAIVIYMPDEVGNEANYLTVVDDTGKQVTHAQTLSDGTSIDLFTNQPFINLGISVVATQYTHEVDSFGNDYDFGADGKPDNADAWNQNSTATVYPVVNTTTGANVNVGDNGAISEETTIQDEKATSVIPENTIMKDDRGNAISASGENNGELQREIKTTTEAGSINTVTYDISYNYVENGTSTSVVEFGNPVTNIIQLSANLENVKVTHSHNGVVTQMTEVASSSVSDGEYYYDRNTGELYICSSTYSPFEITYEENFVAVIGNQGYNSLEEALNSVTSDNNKIIIKKDINIEDGIQISNEKNVTIDFNGNTFKGALENGSIINGSPAAELTLMDIRNTGEYSIDSNIVVDEYGGATQLAAVTIWQSVVTINSGRYTHDSAVVLCQLQTSDPNAQALIVNGGTFDGKGAASVIANVFGNVIINDGEFNAHVDGDYSGECVYVDWGNSYVPSITTINGGKFNAEARIFYVDVNDGYTQKIIVNDGTFNVNPGGKLIETSKGEAKNYLTITGGTFNVDPSEYVDTNNYNVTQEGSNWTVTAK